MKKPPDKKTYQCIKTSLKSVVKNQLIVDKLAEAAIQANNIMIHTLQLLKLYILHCYETGTQLPTIDRQFVTSVMKVICEKPRCGRPPSQTTQRIKETLTSFYEQHYKAYLQTELNYQHMNTVLNYLATDVVTMYETNIKQHFVAYVERFVNVSWGKKQLIALIRRCKKTVASRRESSNSLCKQLRHIKNDLLNPNQAPTAHPRYHAWIAQQRLKVAPPRKLQKDSIDYDIQCSPQDYLPSMVYMMKTVESRGASVNHVCPLRSKIIPKHFRLDTISLVNLCFTKEQGKRSDYTTKGNLVKHNDRIWGFFFKTDRKCFHLASDGHDYTFDHQIETDGVSCSIILKRKGLIGKRVPTLNTTKNDQGETYIDEVPDYAALKGKRVVAIDPNMSDLLYCVDSDGREQVKFRYTQETRRKETKVKKYRNYLQLRKQEIIAGKSVGEWETELSVFNKKTTDFVRFKAYLKQKNEVNAHLSPFYNESIFRKLKLGGFMRRQITEARLLKRFEQLFDGPQETIIAVGDFEQRRHRQFKEPVKGKGFRTLFRRAGYQVYLVDEFRTSCRCSACHGECTTFRECENPRPYRSGRIFRHGLVKCQTCSRLWNRDTNAASNIWKVARNAIRGEERPKYLRRAIGSLSGAPSASHNHDLHGDEKPQRLAFEI